MMQQNRMPVHSLARSVGLGRIAYHLWHRPLAWVADSLREGGPFERRRTERGRQQMEAAAAELPTLPPSSPAQVPIHLLTGRRFWYQTAFCLWSLSKSSGRTVAPMIYDDGTLDEGVRTPLARIFPLARFVEKLDCICRLDEFLPVKRYPSLRERWTNYPHIRKLIDPHVGSSAWKFVSDSDLLFFRSPDFLLHWIDHPRAPLHAVDCKTSYGYSRSLIERLAARPVADLVNVGLTGLNGSELDWDQIEHWCRELQAKEGTNYYLEQALVAMILAGRACSIAPGSDYVTLPRQPEVHSCRAAMHHYVAESKRWYFQKNWRRVLVTAA
jgi:hypothetical protein